MLVGGIVDQRPDTGQAASHKISRTDYRSGVLKQDISAGRHSAAGDIYHNRAVQVDIASDIDQRNVGVPGSSQSEVVGKLAGRSKSQAAGLKIAVGARRSHFQSSPVSHGIIAQARTGTQDGQFAGVDRRGTGVSIRTSQNDRATAIVGNIAHTGNDSSHGKRVTAIKDQRTIIGNIADSQTSAGAAVANLHRAGMDGCATGDSAVHRHRQSAAAGFVKIPAGKQAEAARKSIILGGIVGDAGRQTIRRQGDRDGAAAGGGVIKSHRTGFDIIGCTAASEQLPVE